MKKISAKPISAQSWMLTEWGNRVGVLSAQDGSYTLLSSQKTETFSSQEALEKSLGWHITFEQLEAKEEPLDKIGVWPIKHTNPQNVQDSPFVTYSKTAHSKSRFAAGYWGIHYSHGWSPSFCPKMETVENAPTVGPFSSKLELNTVLNKKQKEGQKQP
jgi:hypothetical protein